MRTNRAVVNGVLSHREDPSQPWVPFTVEQLSEFIRQMAEREFQDWCIEKYWRAPTGDEPLPLPVYDTRIPVITIV